MQSFVPPRFAYAMAILAILVVSGVLAATSRNALPGDTLYGAKLAVEKTQVRFTSNPARRAVVQMEFAGNRLKEARVIKKEGGVTNGRVDDALSRFAKDVTEATSALKQAADPIQVKAATSEIVQKAAEYQQELQNDFPVSSVKKPAREVKFASLEQAERALEGVLAEKSDEEDEEKNDAEMEQKSQSDDLGDGEVGI